MNAAWIVIAIFVVTVCDALRDCWVSRTVGWWQWHIVKWIAFYTPPAALTILFIPWPWWAPLIIAAWILWRVVYRLRCERVFTELRAHENRSGLLSNRFFYRFLWALHSFPYMLLKYVAKVFSCMHFILTGE